MEVTTSKRMGLTMLVAALILWSSINVDVAFASCKITCVCIGLPVACFPKCIRECSGESLTSLASEHYNVGCFLSICLDYHPGTEKVGADVKKVGACEDSCSQVCKKTYPLD